MCVCVYIKLYGIPFKAYGIFDFLCAIQGLYSCGIWNLVP